MDTAKKESWYNHLKLMSANYLSIYLFRTVKKYMNK